MADTTQSAGTVETKSEVRKSPSDFTRHWLEAIDLAGKEEEDWRKAAEETLKRYRQGKPKSFNILYANTQTVVPALYNSEPLPDVRRRFGDDDQNGRHVASVIERGLSVQAELYDFDGCMKAAVRDRQIQGRGVTRVRVVRGQNGSKHLECESVIWDDFRRGPAKVWRDVPWIAFRHKYTREELTDLNATVGPKVNLDAVIGDAPKKTGDSLPDMFKRATVWEVWDRSERKVYFFAESFPDGPLLVVDDPYELRQFWPIPEPLYALPTSDSLVPVCEFTIWKALADEVDALTGRIIGIVKVLKWKGLYDGRYAKLVEKLKTLDDGDIAGADDAAASMAAGGIERAIWMMPVESAAKLVESLYLAREQAKNQLYELTGVADILRGSTNAAETATAQNIKAQWGSLRLQEAQRDVQRYARDLFRIMADLMIGKMDAPALSAMTGFQVTDELLQPYRDDLQREFVIEIETDSTIRADLSRAQSNIMGFGEMFGNFVEGAMPLVQSGFMPGPVAIRILGGVMRNFKLGRTIEGAFDDWQKHVEQMAQQPQQAQPDPKVEAEKAKAAGVAQKVQLEGQLATAKHGMEMQKMQGQAELDRTKAGIEMQKLEASIAADQIKAGLAQQQMHAEVQMQGAEHAMQREAMEADREAQREGHAISMEGLAAKSAAQREAAKAKQNGGGKR